MRTSILKPPESGDLEDPAKQRGGGADLPQLLLRSMTPRNPDTRSAGEF